MKSVQTWADRNHTKRANDPPSVCPICNGEFRQKAPAGRPQIYCSRPCAIEMMRRQKHDATLEKNCIQCGILFRTNKWKINIRKFCSPECGFKYNGKRGSVVLSCQVCGKEFRRNPGNVRGIATCSNRCMGIAKRKDWPSSGKFAAVRKWFSRHGRMSECVKCGYKDVPGILVLHHKNRDRTDNTRENLEVLCPNCHALEHLPENKNGWQHTSTDYELKRRYRNVG